ncbi:hypothetical protein DIPPA_00554 [Diplonema papillatum]|nr:hypothetical protein DIPPA_00554 [Diplonema papillatum]
MKVYTCLLAFTLCSQGSDGVHAHTTLHSTDTANARGHLGKFNVERRYPSSSAQRWSPLAKQESNTKRAARQSKGKETNAPIRTARTRRPGVSQSARETASRRQSKPNRPAPASNRPVSTPRGLFAFQSLPASGEGNERRGAALDVVEKARAGRGVTGISCSTYSPCISSPLCCPDGWTCFKEHRDYAECRVVCPDGWDCGVVVVPPEETPSFEALCGGTLGEGAECTAAPLCCADGFACYGDGSAATCTAACANAACTNFTEEAPTSTDGRIVDAPPRCPCPGWLDKGSYCAHPVGGGHQCTGPFGSRTVCAAGSYKCFGDGDAAASSRNVISLALTEVEFPTFEPSVVLNAIRDVLNDTSIRMQWSYFCLAHVCPFGRCVDPINNPECIARDSSTNVTSLVRTSVVLAIEVHALNKTTLSAKVASGSLQNVIYLYDRWEAADYDAKTTSPAKSSHIIVWTIVAVTSASIAVAGFLYFTHVKRKRSKIRFTCCSLGDLSGTSVDSRQVLSELPIINV